MENSFQRGLRWDRKSMNRLQYTLGTAKGMKNRATPFTAERKYLLCTSDKGLLAKTYEELQSKTLVPNNLNKKLKRQKMQLINNII